MSKLIWAIVLVGVCLGSAGANAASAPSADNKLTLTWEPVPGAAIGYNVYFGETREGSDMQRLPVPHDLKLADPAVEFDILMDLSAAPGQQVCFRVEAYDNVSASDFSSAVCVII
jgi:hypothetical protein